jgi:hypothetical protein
VNTDFVYARFGILHIDPMMASQKVAIDCVIVLSRALEILHVCLRTYKKQYALYMTIFA